MANELLTRAPRDGDVPRRTYELRASTRDAEGRTLIEGHASVWGSLNSYGEVFVPGAFAESLERKSDARPFVMAWLHREPIGRWSEYREEETGLYVAGPISKTRQGEDAATLVSDGAITGLSIGFWPEEWTFAEPGEQVTFETQLGRFTYRFDEWVIYVTKADVVEASLVIAPADDEARLIQRALEQARRALPALEREASWEDAAYSMALLMGGRGAAAFAELPDLERRKLYARVAIAYERHGKTPPAYEPKPHYPSIEFRHDERELFHDRYLGKQLDSIVAGAAGFGGALSAETREKAKAAVSLLTDLAARRSAEEELADLSALLRQTAAMAADLTRKDSPEHA